MRVAVDIVYPSEAELRAAAAAGVLAAEPMEVPELQELLAELDEVRGRRG